MNFIFIYHHFSQIPNNKSKSIHTCGIHTKNCLIHSQDAKHGKHFHRVVNNNGHIIQTNLEQSKMTKRGFS